MSAATYQILPRLPLYQAARPGELSTLILLTALALAPLALQLPLWVSGVTGLVIVWRYWLNLRQLRLPPAWILAILAITGLFAVILQYGPPTGRDPGVALLTIMVALKLLETYRGRDIVVAAFIGLFANVTSFFFSQGMLLATYNLLIMLAFIGLLLSLTKSPPGQAAEAGAAALKPRTSFRQALGLLAQAIPIMIILFVLFPRIEGSLWGGLQTNDTAVTGLSDSMRPGSIGELARSYQIALRVSFAGEPPPPGQRYWRGPVLDYYDGQVWQNRGRRSAPSAPQASAASQRYRYTVRLAAHGKRWLLTLDRPTDIPRSAERLTTDWELLSAKPLYEDQRYTLTSAPQIRQPALTANARQRFLQLPADLDPRVVTLAQGWRTTARDAAAVIDAAQAHFGQAPFRYSLTPPITRQDPVAQFLFETRTGFCEHYASAFVVLMRAAGLPARVVTGYLGGERNTVGDYLLVRQADAHAWAEVWLPEQGWQRVDPTAAVSPDRVEQGISGAIADSGDLHPMLRGGAFRDALRQLGLWWDSVNYYWNEWVVAFGPEKQRQLLQALGLNGKRWVWLTGLMTAALVTVIVLYAGIYLWRNRRLPLTPLDRAYAAFCRKLARRGFGKAAHEGPWDYAQRLNATLPEQAAIIRAVTVTYAQMRYADRDDPRGVQRIRSLTRQI